MTEINTLTKEHIVDPRNITLGICLSGNSIYIKEIKEPLTQQLFEKSFDLYFETDLPDISDCDIEINSYELNLKGFDDSEDEILLNSYLSNIPTNFNYFVKKRNINIKININCLKLNDKYSFLKNLPSCINHLTLTFDNYFNQSVDNLPIGITHLTFGENFYQSVDNLPIGITHLTFGQNFNKQVDNLPNSIIHLTFGEYFNQSIDNLPKSIRHLTLGDYFNQLVDNLPNSITHLTFGKHFNQSVDNLPTNLKKLILGNGFIYDLTCASNLQHIGTYHHAYICDFNNPVDNLPKQLEEFSLRYNGCYQHSIDNLPDSVKIIELGYYLQPIKKLPLNLEKIYIREKYISNFSYLKDLKSDIQFLNYDDNDEKELYDVEVDVEEERRQEERREMDF